MSTPTTHPCATGPWRPGTDANILATPFRDTRSGGSCSNACVILVRMYREPFVARIVALSSSRVWAVENMFCDTRTAARLEDVLWFAEIRDPT